MMIFVFGALMLSYALMGTDTISVLLLYLLIYLSLFMEFTFVLNIIKKCKKMKTNFL